MGSDKWQFMKPLPYEFGVVRGATLNNDFFVFGTNFEFRHTFHFLFNCIQEEINFGMILMFTM